LKPLHRCNNYTKSAFRRNAGEWKVIFEAGGC